jgi:hypothetical protein
MGLYSNNQRFRQRLLVLLIPLFLTGAAVAAQRFGSIPTGNNNNNNGGDPGNQRPLFRGRSNDIPALTSFRGKGGGYGKSGKSGKEDSSYDDEEEEGSMDEGFVEEAAEDKKGEEEEEEPAEAAEDKKDEEDEEEAAEEEEDNKDEEEQEEPAEAAENEILVEDEDCMSLGDAYWFTSQYSLNEASCMNDPDSCSGGCCRVGTYIFCDEQNEFPHLSCVCNSNTAANNP